MEAQPLKDLSKLCIHTITTRPWSLEDAIRHYSAAGVAGISVWRQAIEGQDPAEAGRHIREAGLSVVSLVRGGFYPAREKKDRRKAIDENLRIIDEAAALQAPHVVLVCGAVPGQPLAESRKQIREGIEATLPHCAETGVKLAIEPLHPMYADSRSAINTLAQANDLAEAIDSPLVGVAVDVYHLWWDPDLEQQIRRCGRMKKILAFHICDWKTPTEDLLYDRGLMGEGCIPIRQIRGWVEASGFSGFNEVEIFSTLRWTQNQDQWLQEIIRAYREAS
ncbi:MAG: sugar phosphate isomerase/epimerase [Spirochaetaceae bacterium]|nr:MAG: sugar phosphate isomerase/epimerase [Spirochaetaceae bacterium]